MTRVPISAPLPVSLQSVVTVLGSRSSTPSGAPTVMETPFSSAQERSVVTTSSICVGVRQLA
ncbi:MAG: hypothetical protein HOV80_20980 [Polyangiaceae bacterium]|nr:hypothetical protein [Polyangiaceae bacterium]